MVGYKNQPFEDEVSPVDMVYDLIGGETQERSWQVLKKGGALVSTLNEPSQAKASECGVRGLRYTAAESGEDLTEIGQLIDPGQVNPS